MKAHLAFRTSRCSSHCQYAVPLFTHGHVLNSQCLEASHSCARDLSDAGAVRGGARLAEDVTKTVSSPGAPCSVAGGARVARKGSAIGGQSEAAAAARTSAAPMDGAGET